MAENQNWLDDVQDWVINGPVGKFSDEYLAPIADYMKSKHEESMQGTDVNDPDADPWLKLVKAIEMQRQGDVPDDSMSTGTEGAAAGQLALPPQKSIPLSAGPSSKGPLAGEPEPAKWQQTYQKGSPAPEAAAAAEEAGLKAATEVMGPGGKGKLISKIDKILRYAIPAFATGLAGTVGGAVAVHKQRVKQHAKDDIATNQDIPIMPPIAKKTAEEKAARQEIEAPTSAIKEKPFDIDEIIKKYGGTRALSPNSFLTDQDIPNPESQGLIDKGLVANLNRGTKSHIYEVDRSKAQDIAGGNRGSSSDPKIITDAISRLGYDPRTFNPAEEARKSLEQDMSRYFNWTFRGNAHPSYLTPEQAKHWQANIKELFQQRFQEASIKQQLGYRFLQDALNYNRKRIVKGPEGSVFTHNEKTDEMDLLVPGKDREKRLSENVAKVADTKIASFFKPLVTQDDKLIEIKNPEDVYNNLDLKQKELFDELQGDVYRILTEDPALSASQAFQKAIKGKGWLVERAKGKDNKPGRFMINTGNQKPPAVTAKIGGSGAPPLPGAQKSPKDGKWYVQQNGRWFKVEDK